MIAMKYTNSTQSGDIDRGASVGTILVDEGLKTVVLVSLFTWRRSLPDDVIPSALGWWGDTLAEVPGDQIGSRLWTLFSRKVDQNLLDDAIEISNEALQWMLDDGVASEILVTAERRDVFGMDLIVAIQRPEDLAPRFIGRWNFTTNKLIVEAA
jgi:phage gp46-like protein